MPYKLTDMGRTYPTPQYPAPKPRGNLTSVTPEGRKLEAEHKAGERVRDKARRAG